MAVLAINLLALIIVLGLCWGAMMWLSGRFHGHRRSGEDVQRMETFDDLDLSRLDEIGQDPCPVCEGVGATTTRGKLAPCPECLGTGVH